MGRAIRTYSKIEEASNLVSALCEKHPDAFWAVIPSTILVMGVDNVERSEKAVAKEPYWSKLRNVKGVEEAIFRDYNIPVRYIIKVFYSDWNKWKDSIRLGVLAENMFAITPDTDKKNRFDCNGFHILYKALGLDWKIDNKQVIPNLLGDEVEFDLTLRPGMDDLINEDNDD